jgi:hypothetical protein
MWRVAFTDKQRDCVETGNRTLFEPDARRTEEAGARF